MLKPISMKKSIFILTASVLLISCGNDGKGPTVDELIAAGDLEEIRAKRTEIREQQTTIQNELKRLDKAIQDLDKSENQALVTVHMLNDTLFRHFIEIQGNVTTKQNVIIRPEFQGTLTRVYVKEGDKVTKGQILAKIDDGGLSSQLSQLEVQTQLARTTFERQARLWEQKIGSEIQYLQAKTNYEAAQRAVDQLKSQLAKTNVRAPFSGVIDNVITEQGSVVSMGQELFRIVNLSDMYVEAEVPERYLSSVLPGKDVAINFPVLGESMQSTVRQTGNYINPANRAFTIEVDVPNDSNRVKPNLTARLRINDYTNPEAILVPMSVISENSQGDQYVYVANTEEGPEGTARAERKIITTGQSQGDYIEVIAGLDSGVSIIIEGARTVKDGQQVKIINQ